MDIQTINNIPKIDLHCHLDGSLSFDFVNSIYPQSMDEMKNAMEAPADCPSLTKYLEKFDLPIKCLQSKPNLYNAILDVCKNASLENVQYIEIRFAPYFSRNDNFSYRDIFEVCTNAVNAAEQEYNIKSNIIVCAMRHLSTADNLNMLEESYDYIGHGICALDLAGDESRYDNELFEALFARAKDMRIPFTIHSGECGRTKNVELALYYGAKRIGHGIALTKDVGLINKCRQARLGIELCPTSNFQTKAITSVSEYPLRTFLDNGLAATINTDNRTVSNTCMNKELLFSLTSLGLDESELELIYKNSVEISFADDNTKNELLKKWK